MTAASGPGGPLVGAKFSEGAEVKSWLDARRRLRRLGGVGARLEARRRSSWTRPCRARGGPRGIIPLVKQSRCIAAAPRRIASIGTTSYGCRRTSASGRRLRRSEAWLGPQIQTLPAIRAPTPVRASVSLVRDLSIMVMRPASSRAVARRGLGGDKGACSCAPAVGSSMPPRAAPSRRPPETRGAGYRDRSRSRSRSCWRRGILGFATHVELAAPGRASVEVLALTARPPTSPLDARLRWRRRLGFCPGRRVLGCAVESFRADSSRRGTDSAAVYPDPVDRPASCFERVA